MTRLRVLAMVLAGGEGKRLWPLTADRAKAAVSFGGSFRLVDVVLSNLVNSGYRRIFILTQYKSHSLNRHITSSWRMSPLLDAGVYTVPAQQRLGPRWYKGSADAIYQSLNLVYDDSPDYLIVLGANHIYQMDLSEMVADHISSGADVTVAGVKAWGCESATFGFIRTDGRRITGFLKRPSHAIAAWGQPDTTYASMGNYVFTTSALIGALNADAADENSLHDLGNSIVPLLASRGRASIYDFARNIIPGSTDVDRGYWRDVSTLNEYYAAHLDLLTDERHINLYNREWPIFTWPGVVAPARITEGGAAQDSLIGAGTSIIGAAVHRSVVAHNVRIEAGSRVENSIILPGVRIGRDTVISNTILDKNVTVTDGATIGVEGGSVTRGLTAHEHGITVIGKGSVVGV
jgi:glucose-1-phosphate adenylyltransferase